jgi:hypothetical protein
MVTLKHKRNITVTRGKLAVAFTDICDLTGLSEDDLTALECILKAADKLTKPVEVSFDALREHVSNVATVKEVLTAVQVVRVQKKKR